LSRIIKIKRDQDSNELKGEFKGLGDFDFNYKKNKIKK